MFKIEILISEELVGYLMNGYSNAIKNKDLKYSLQLKQFLLIILIKMESYKILQKICRSISVKKEL